MIERLQDRQQSRHNLVDRLLFQQDLAYLGFPVATIENRLREYGVD